MTKINRGADKETLAQAEPFVRGILAFIIFTFRKSGPLPADMESAYEYADRFISNLQSDLERK